MKFPITIKIFQSKVGEFEKFRVPVWNVAIRVGKCFAAITFGGWASRVYELRMREAECADFNKTNPFGIKGQDFDCRTGRFKIK